MASFQIKILKSASEHIYLQLFKIAATLLIDVNCKIWGNHRCFKEAHRSYLRNHLTPMRQAAPPMPAENTCCRSHQSRNSVWWDQEKNLLCHAPSPLEHLAPKWVTPTLLTFKTKTWRPGSASWFETPMEEYHIGGGWSTNSNSPLTPPYILHLSSPSFSFNYNLYFIIILLWFYTFVDLYFWLYFDVVSHPESLCNKMGGKQI